MTGREAPGDTLHSLGGTREARKDHLDSPGGARDHQGGRKGPFWTVEEAPGRHQGGTREAGKDHLDSLRGTREAPGRQGPFGQPGRHQEAHVKARPQYPFRVKPLGFRVI